MASNFKTLVIGTTGLISTEVAAQVTDVVSVPVSDWTTAATQLIIAIATLIGLFRKKKSS